MSKEKSTSPDSVGNPPGAAPVKRRVAQARTGKSTKPAKTIPQESAGAVVDKPVPAYPVFEPSDVPLELAPEVDSAESSGELPPQEGSKRKRRRKKGKGGASQVGVQAVIGESSTKAGEEVSAAEVGSPPARPVQPPRPKLDPESVAKLAWKIYLAEVSEEGVALIGDNDAKELSRRCFRLAEIFVEEQNRRR